MRFYESLRKFMKVYESLLKFMKATIFHDIFLVKSLAFVPFHSIAMSFFHFVISYRDERNFSVCYCTVSPLDNIGKYFAIVKRLVIFPISQILNCFMQLAFNLSIGVTDTLESTSILIYLEKHESIYTQEETFD